MGREKDEAAQGAEAVGDSEDDGEDVFEVEKILDMKVEGVRAGPGPGGWLTRGGRRGRGGAARSGGAGGGVDGCPRRGDVERRLPS